MKATFGHLKFLAMGRSFADVKRAPTTSDNPQFVSLEAFGTTWSFAFSYVCVYVSACYGIMLFLNLRIEFLWPLLVDMSRKLILTNLDQLFGWCPHTTLVATMLKYVKRSMDNSFVRQFLKLTFWILWLSCQHGINQWKLEWSHA